MRLALCAVLSIALLGCASVPQQIPETMKSACELYQQVRPDIVAFRSWAKDHWSEIPPEARNVLLRLDAYTDDLDEAGRVVCAVSAGFDPPSGAKWDQILSTVVRVAALAAEWKAAGHL